MNPNTSDIKSLFFVAVTSIQHQIESLSTEKKPFFKKKTKKEKLVILLIYVFYFKIYNKDTSLH